MSSVQNDDALESARELECIANGLKVAKENGLEAEFVWSLFYSDHDIGVCAAVSEALYDWDM